MSKHDAITVCKAWPTFLKLVGGVESLSEVLTYVDNDERIARFLGYLHDPVLASDLSVKSCAEDCNLSLSSVRYAYIRGVTAKAKFERDKRLAEASPAIVSDMVEDARSHTETCPRCDGSGRVTLKQGERTCSDCYGKGKVRVHGDKDDRALVAEAVGLVHAKGGTQLNTQINIGPLESFEDAVVSVQKALAQPSVTTEVIVDAAPHPPNPSEG